MRNSTRIEFMKHRVRPELHYLSILLFKQFVISDRQTIKPKKYNHCKNKANLMDLIAATGLVTLLILEMLNIGNLA